jgi:enoyl-[acyl-carrier protein] reductase I
MLHAMAVAVKEHGADLAFTYQGEALLKRIEPLAGSIGSSKILECDVSNEAQLDSVFLKNLVIYLLKTFLLNQTRALN